jgi:hypothetical protein
MNINEMRANKCLLPAGAYTDMLQGFKTALIWQDNELDNIETTVLSYQAQEKTNNTVMTFLSVVLCSNEATKQLLQHGLSQSGHDLALQMIGHGVGFWEVENSKILSDILDFLLDMKSIKPWHYFYDVNQNKLDWDSI